MTVRSRHSRAVACAVAFLAILGSVARASSPPGQVFDAGERDLTIQFDAAMRTRLVSRLDGATSELGPFRPSDYVVVNGKPVLDYAVTKTNRTDETDSIGASTRFEISGETGQLRKDVMVTVYADFPSMAFVRATYTNTGTTPVRIDRWVSQRYLESGKPSSAGPPFWSYQGGSYESRPNWVLPLSPGFAQQNFMGMNASDYGGGTPVVDVWRRDVGVAVGHVELRPSLVSLPVAMRGRAGAELGIEEQVDRVLAPGESLETPRTFVAVHRGDYFAALAEYRRFMIAEGVKFPAVGEASYEPIWCGWGYDRTVTADEIYRTLPKAAELGFKWAVLDDGWQTAEGDWYLTPSKFPNGDRDMQKLTAGIRARGLKPMLWWTPLAVDPGTDLIRDHPDYVLINKDGQKQKISWWDAFYLCPAYPPVREYTEKLVEKFLGDWDFDGLKIDGQHLNGAPPCFNPAHHHAAPTDSVEGMPEFFRAIYETAKRIKPDAVIEICPCGTGYAFHTMPFMNLAVASDPESSWQVRLKGKTLKALMGPEAPYFGDHVELSDGGNDFASTVGVGGVVGTQFTLREAGKSDPKYWLTAAKERVWRKWLAIYTSEMLSTGEYLGGLYDIGFDRPEVHAIRKDGRMYYAFYAKGFAGTVELRGLEDRGYRVRDYENDREYGTVRGPEGRVKVRFARHLMLEAAPSADR